MPWRKDKGGGYRTRRGGHIDRPGVYERLRGKGFGKGKAARFANRKVE